MKKGLLILMVVAGMIVLLGGLLIYGLGINEIVPVPRPDLIVVSILATIFTLERGVTENTLR